MATNSTTNKPLTTPKPTSVQPGPVAADHVYPLPVFKGLTGLGGWALRQAQRNGLRIVTVGRCKFVRGADFIDYLASIETPEDFDS